MNFMWGAKTLFDKKITSKNGNNNGNLDIIITIIFFNPRIIAENICKECKNKNPVNF